MPKPLAQVAGHDHLPPRSWSCGARKAEAAGATMGPIGTTVSAPVRNWPMHLANCAAASVPRAEQLVSLAKGSSPLHGYHSFPTEQIHRTFRPRFATASPQEANSKLMGDAQNWAENAQTCTEKAT